METVTSEGPEDKQTADPVVVEEASDIAVETEASPVVPTEAPLAGSDLRRPVESETVQETGNGKKSSPSSSSNVALSSLQFPFIAPPVPSESQQRDVYRYDTHSTHDKMPRSPVYTPSAGSVSTKSQGTGTRRRYYYPSNNRRSRRRNMRSA